MPSLIFTPEQEACLVAAKESSSSLLINALAGAAKTTTLVAMAGKLPLVPTLCVAFNKRIAEELAKRMPSHITCATMNSLGHRVWGQAIGKRLVLDIDKSYKTLTEIGKALPHKRGEDKFEDNFSAILKAVRLSKSSGFIPESMRKFGESLVSSEDMMEIFARQLDVDPTDTFLHFVDQVLERSIADAFEGRVDFDDQIYMSTLFQGAKYTKYPIVMVDEAQDLSPLNHKTLEKMYGGRLIAVGDPYQAIYAFRGASQNSMEELRSRFDMQELTLSTSFRCPQRVVENARWRVPHMLYPDWAQVGLVETLSEWGPTSIPDGAAIICRQNAPLFSLAMSLIQAGRGIKLVGNDVGAGLLKILDKLGPGDLARSEVLLAIDSWEEAERKKAHRARLSALVDKANCLRVFAEVGATLDEAKAYAKMIFSASGPINLMTGHKSKGLEFDVVFHLNPSLIPSNWAQRAAGEGDRSQLEQEYNLRYVIESRAKHSLFLVELEDFA
jgi:superfamily I DNA/RNA helicase